MARGINQIEVVNRAVFGAVLQRSRLRLDGDATLFFDVHRIEHLFLHLPRFQAAAMLDQAIGQRRFAMVDVGNDGEIAYVLHPEDFRLDGSKMPGGQTKKRAHQAMTRPQPSRSGRTPCARPEAF